MPKYFLTTKEAADYCCVSVRQFLKLQKPVNGGRCRCQRAQ